MSGKNLGIGLIGEDLTPNHEEPSAGWELLFWILETILDLVW